MTMNEIRNMNTTTGFGVAVINFAVNGYESTMKRKTWTEDDKKALAILKEMVADLEAKEKSFE